MKRFLKLMLFTTVLAYLAVCLALFFGQRSFIYHPTHSNGEIPSRTTSMAVAGATLKISVRENDSQNALIYFGGNAEDVAHSLASFEKAFPNHAIYMLHYRGYSGSTGEPSENALHEDAQKLYDMVKTKHNKIWVIGRSLGSGVAIHLAALHEVSKLILITPYDSILNLAKQQFPYFPVSLILSDRFESWKYAPQVKAPTVILAADGDQVIPSGNTKILFAAFSQGIADLKIIQNVDHYSIVTTPDYFHLMQ